MLSIFCAPSRYVQGRDATEKLKLDQAKKAPAATPPAPLPSQVNVGDPWTDETQRRVYAYSGPPSIFGKIAYAIVLESPVPIYPLTADIMDPFLNSDAERIANHCKTSFPER